MGDKVTLLKLNKRKLLWLILIGLLYIACFIPWVPYGQYEPMIFGIFPIVFAIYLMIFILAFVAIVAYVYLDFFKEEMSYE